MSLLYLRYVGDISIKQKGTKKQSIKFKKLNKKFKKRKIEYQISLQEITFLDTIAY